MPKRLSHYDLRGQARMVDVSAKRPTRREAMASAFVALAPRVLKALPRNPKGNPLEIARFAGIAAAKRTPELIPMCHQVPLSHIDVHTELCKNGVAITASAATTAVTGVEMEALVAASVAALTVYDMCKALDKGIEIRDVLLERKTGGKSGDYRRPKLRRFAGLSERAKAKRRRVNGSPQPKSRAKRGNREPIETGAPSARSTK